MPSLVFVTSGASLRFRHLNSCSVEAQIADALLLILNIHSASDLYSGAAAGPRVPAVMAKSPDLPGLKCGGPFSVISVVHFCVFVMRVGGQHDRLKRALELEPDRQGFECRLPHLLGIDCRQFQNVRVLVHTMRE